MFSGGFNFFEEIFGVCLSEFVSSIEPPPTPTPPKRVAYVYSTMIKKNDMYRSMGLKTIGRIKVVPLSGLRMSKTTILLSVYPTFLCDS